MAWRPSAEKKKRALAAPPGLGHEQGIVVAVIEFQYLQICGGIVLVNVGRQNIQRGRRDFPDGEHIVGGAAAFVGAGSARGGTDQAIVLPGHLDLNDRPLGYEYRQMFLSC